MAIFQSNPDQIDHLSSLSDALLITIISLLPTYIAARTSVLSRRFRHLWKTSPSVDLSTKCIPNGQFKHSTYAAMANSSLLTRTSSNSLLRLHLDLGYPVLSYHLSNSSFFCSLLVHAHALGLRHLTIDGYWGIVDFELLLSFVFSISSLQSLSIQILPPMTCPCAIALTRLKSLSINLFNYNSTQVQWLLSQLCCLEDLQLGLSCGLVCLSSRTIKKLNLLLVATHPEPYSLGLSMPSLELLCLRNLSIHADVPLIHGEIPFVRKAVITLDCLRPKHVTAVAQFLNCISHVEELCLDLQERIVVSDDPFPVLLEPGKEVSTFPNLKNLEISICFHECNIEAVVMMLHHSTALESLELQHKTSDMLGVKRAKRIAWRSMLPCNSDGSNRYVCLKNLHLGENREEFKKLLNKRCTPMRQRVR